MYFCSCFLLTMHSDSIEGIYDTLKQCALISKSAGGIGLNVHCIRSTGSYIAGVSIPTVRSIVGITPMCGKKKNIKSYPAAVWNSFLLFSYEISAKSILVLFFWSHLQQKLYMLKYCKTKLTWCTVYCRQMEPLMDCCPCWGCTITRPDTWTREETRWVGVHVYRIFT